MTVTLFRQSLEALQGKPDPFSREFIQWLRELVATLNTTGPIGSATPAAVSSSAGSAGVSANVSREDHVHQLTIAVVQALIATASAAFDFNGQDLTEIDEIYSSTGGIISGFAGVRTNGSQDFAIRDSGDGGGASFFWQGRSRMKSPSDGVIAMLDNAAATFSRLQLGGTTSSFPALKRNSAAIESRLADDSAYAVHRVATPVGANDAVTKAYADAVRPIAQVEVDLGSTPVYSGKFTITDATIGATDKIIIAQAGGPYTGKGTLGDEAEMDAIDVAATPAAGSATAYWNSRTAVRGNFKFNYQRAA